MFSGGRNSLNKDNKQNSENKTGIIIGLGAALVVGAVVLCIALVSVLGESSSGKEDTTRYVLTSGVNQSLTETNNNQINDLLDEMKEKEMETYGLLCELIGRKFIFLNEIFNIFWVSIWNSFPET